MRITFKDRTMEFHRIDEPICCHDQAISVVFRELVSHRFGAAHGGLADQYLASHGS